jgi:hypothetical protein
MMKKIIYSVVLMSILLTAGCKKDDNNAKNITTQINDFPLEPLNDSEKLSLMHMREEEKLAYDVYITFFAKYNKSIFQNIAESENTHKTAVLTLLSKYSMADPVNQNAVGVFQDSSLQALYHALILEGYKSELNALKVGATIEDLDIYDLDNWMKNVDNQDIQFVFNNLNKGSRNHLRSFYSTILNSGGTYTPQFISKSLFDSIVSTDKETGSW